MSYEVRADGGFTVLGISTRTSNAEPQQIGELWRRFHEMGGAQAVAERTNDAAICVYGEYTSDWRGDFTVVIGCDVLSGAIVPEGMQKIDVPSGNFALFEESYQQQIPAAVAWAKVWKTPLERCYQADFDRYGESSVTVHVGVK